MDDSDLLDGLEDLLGAYARAIEAGEGGSKSQEMLDLYRSRIAVIEAARAEIKKWRAWGKPIPARYGDLSDLPDELLAQLSGVKTDELEDQIYAAVKAAGEQIELDNLLIALFRRHGDIHERRFLNNKCYRMVQKGLIFQVPGRKGVYSVHDQAGRATPTVSDDPDEADDG